MYGKIKAPWDGATVAALNAFQDREEFHPFTCPREHLTPGEAKLIATLDGWTCSRAPACGYTQDWAHTFMAQVEPQDDFRDREVTYWRGRAEIAEYQLKRAAEIHPGLPPEPPVGTQFFQGDGKLIWEHHEDGWRCTESSCVNCPCDWGEAISFGMLLDPMLTRRLP